MSFYEKIDAYWLSKIEKYFDTRRCTYSLYDDDLIKWFKENLDEQIVVEFMLCKFPEIRMEVDHD